MPSFSEIKSKASKVTSSGVGKIQNVRDRNTSVPMKKTNWDPYNGAPPPPPPPRINPNNKPQALAAFPPPPSRVGSSIGSGSTSSAQLSRAQSNASSVAPPLPSRGSSTGAPPPLPRRSNTLSPPALPSRGSSLSPPSSGLITPSPPPPPPTRCPLPPPSRNPGSVHTSSPPPPPTNSATKPGSTSVSSVLAPPPVLPARAPLSRQSAPVPREQSISKLASHSQNRDEIDWARLTDEDKQVFFGWLDDFFTRFLGVPVGPVHS